MTLVSLFILLAFSACSPRDNSEQKNAAEPDSLVLRAGYADEVMATNPTIADTLPIDYDTTQWQELWRQDTGFVLELRYATDSNFVGQPMYSCARAFLRPAVARALAEALTEVGEKGLRIKIWDAYRPLPVQWRLWNKVPDRRYVADPRRGSMHNRGAAVDLTLVDQQGRELEMGTPYDFFGREAWPSYTSLPDTVLANRRYLLQVMERHGFRPTPSEWWHYSYARKSFPLSEWEWACP